MRGKERKEYVQYMVMSIYIVYGQHILHYVCILFLSLEAKYRAVMGMGTLVSDRVRPHSDKSAVKHLSYSHMWEGAHPAGFCGEYGCSSKVIKFLVSMGTVP